MNETWKEISLLGGRYSASTLGNIRNNRTGTVLKPIVSNRGYAMVYIKYQSIKKGYQIHRLILSTFNPIKNWEKLQVNHKNWDVLDNRLDNLEWVTGKENLLKRRINSFPNTIKELNKLFLLYTDDELATKLSQL